MGPGRTPSGQICSELLKCKNISNVCFGFFKVSDNNKSICQSFHHSSFHLGQLCCFHDPSLQIAQHCRCHDSPFAFPMNHQKKSSYWKFHVGDDEEFVSRCLERLLMKRSGTSNSDVDLIRLTLSWTVALLFVVHHQLNPSRIVPKLRKLYPETCDALLEHGARPVERLIQRLVLGLVCHSIL